MSEQDLNFAANPDEGGLGGAMDGDQRIDDNLMDDNADLEAVPKTAQGKKRRKKKKPAPDGIIGDGMDANGEGAFVKREGADMIGGGMDDPDQKDAILNVLKSDRKSDGDSNDGD